MLGALSVLAPAAGAIEPSGTFIKVGSTAPIYRVVGGAAIHVDSCAPLGGCPNLVIVSNLNGYAPTPANGSLIRIADGSSAGYIGEVFGGTVIHVDSCAPLNGCSGVVQLDSGGVADYMSAHPVPANGSFLRIANGASPGWIGEFVGGSLIHVDSCAPLGGCPGADNIDAGGAADFIAAHPLPANGSFVRVADGPGAGWIGEEVGGSLIHVDSCAPLHGCAGLIELDSGGVGDYQRAHPLPANGTFVTVADGSLAGTVARAAGGAMLPLSSCAALGGCNGYVTLDGGGFSDYVHQHPAPVDGTLLEGVPSGTTWEVLSGQRVPVPAAAGAVAVNDDSLAAIPIAPSSTSGSGSTHGVTGRGRHRVRISLTLRWRWNRARTQLRAVKLGRVGRRMKVRVTCTGRGCPKRVLVGHARHVAKALRHLTGEVLHAGDRLVITVSAPARLPERIGVRIRRSRIPRMALLR